MGVDLTIYPVFPKSDFCHDRISLNTDSDLFDLILRLDSIDFNDGYGLRCYHDSTYSCVRKDCYGDKLKFISPKDIRSIIKTDQFKATCVKNKHIIKFLSGLRNYKLVLYWH